MSLVGVQCSSFEWSGVSLNLSQPRKSMMRRQKAAWILFRNKTNNTFVPACTKWKLRAWSFKLDHIFCEAWLFLCFPIVPTIIRQQGWQGWTLLPTWANEPSAGGSGSWKQPGSVQVLHQGQCGSVRLHVVIASFGCESMNWCILSGSARRLSTSRGGYANWSKAWIWSTDSAFSFEDFSCKTCRSWWKRIHFDF